MSMELKRGSFLTGGATLLIALWLAAACSASPPPAAQSSRVGEVQAIGADGGGQPSPGDSSDVSALRTAAAQTVIQALVTGDVDTAAQNMSVSGQDVISPRLPAMASAFAPCADSTEDYRENPGEPVHVLFTPPCGKARTLVDAEYASDTHRDMALSTLVGDPPLTTCAVIVAPSDGELRVWGIPSCQ